MKHLHTTSQHKCYKNRQRIQNNKEKKSDCKQRAQYSQKNKVLVNRIYFDAG